MNTLCKYIIEDNIEKIKESLNKISVIDLIKLNPYTECDLTEDVLKNERTVFWFAIGLRKYEIVQLLTEKILIDTKWSDNNLGYNTLCKLFTFMDISLLNEIKSLYIQTTEMKLWETQVEQNESDEFIEPTELDENIEWENENDEDISELYFDQYLEILDYFITKGIMDYHQISHSDILCKAAYVKIYDNKFEVLKKLIPIYKGILNVDFNLNKIQKPIISIAIETPSLELIELLLEYKYDYTDYTHSLYNPSFELWNLLVKSKSEKNGIASILQKMYDLLVPKKLQVAYSRGAGEFLSIYTNEFTILEAGYLNKLKDIEYISKSRYKYFQTLLSVCNTEITANGVLTLNGIDINQEIPVNKDTLGIPAQVVSIETLNIFLPELKLDKVENICIYFIKNNKINNAYACLLYLDLEDPNLKFLDMENLLKLGLSKQEYGEYIKKRNINRNSEECCLCGNKTDEKLQCGHFSHYQCLSKCSNTKCPYCKEEYKLPEVYSKAQQKKIESEKKKAESEWRNKYLQLQQIYGENIPANELFRIGTETGV
jgi:hypothetical protein